MLKFGDKVTAPRSMRLEQPVTGIVVGFDEDDVHGWVYDVASEDDPCKWTHKDETVLVTDPRDERVSTLEFQLANMTRSYEDSNEANRAQAERIAQLTLELADTQAKLQLSEERVSILRSQLAVMQMGYDERGDKLRSAEKEHDKAQATIVALKALVCDVSDASAAKEQVWSATEHYNAKAEKAREALAAFQKLERGE